MKKCAFWLLFVICIALIGICPGAWDKNTPAASLSLRASNPILLGNQAVLETTIGQDHEFSTGGTNSGKHLQITFDDPLGAAPAAVGASEGIVYLLDVGSKAELHFEDEDENTVQLTSKGDRLASATYFTATDNAGTGSVNVFKVHTDDTIHFGTTVNLLAGFDLIGTATSDITIGSTAFTVAGATGNVGVGNNLTAGGTLGVTGVATLGDASKLATAAAPTDPCDIANMAYVDAQVSAIETKRKTSPTEQTVALTSNTDTDVTLTDVTALSLVILKIKYSNAAGAVKIGPKGDTDYTGTDDTNSVGANICWIDTGRIAATVVTVTDASGNIRMRAVTTGNYLVTVVAYTAISLI